MNFKNRSIIIIIIIIMIIMMMLITINSHTFFGHGSTKVNVMLLSPFSRRMKNGKRTFGTENKSL